MNKKILIVTQKVDRTDSILGFFHRWIEEFAKNYKKVSVICLEEGENYLPKNVSVYSLGKKRDSITSYFDRLIRVFKFYFYVFKLKNDYDVVWVHMNPIYVVLAGLFWQFWNKKIALWYTHKHVDFKLRLAERLVDVIFTASKESFRLETKKCFVMGHGIDVDTFYPRPVSNSSLYKITTIGRVASVKRCDLIIKILEIIKNSGIPAELDIVGGPVTKEDFSYEKEIRKYVKEHNLSNDVKFVGTMSNKQIADYLPSQNICINMSKTGSLDKAILEAMSCGVVVVTSNEAFAPMLSKFDLMIKSADPEKIADMLISLYKKRDNFVLMGKSLRDIILQKHQLCLLIQNIANLI